MGRNHSRWWRRNRRRSRRKRMLIDHATGLSIRTRSDLPRTKSVTRYHRGMSKPAHRQILPDEDEI